MMGMRFLRRVPWPTVGFIAFGWIAFWVTVFFGFIAQDTSASPPYVAQNPAIAGAAPFSIGWRGAALIFGPPIVLLLLRGLSIRRTARSR
jgi:hypothetical protein